VTQLSVLLERVHDEIPSVPEFMALRALADSTKEFCARTHIWRVSVPDIDLTVGDVAFAVVAPPGLQVVALKDVRLGRDKIYPIPTAVLIARVHTPASGTPMAYAEWAPDQIELDRPVKELATLRIVAAVTLALGAADVEVPDSLIDEYGEALAAGAKMRLMRQAGQPWTSPESSTIYGGPYYAAITAAKGRVMTALGEADMRVEMRSW
jgi:hypothetical protein